MLKILVMKCFVSCGLFIMAFFAGNAQAITITPRFVVGDTIRYRTTATVRMYHEQDSMLSITKMLPEVIVSDSTDVGIVLQMKNKLESFDMDCSVPESEGMLPDKSDELTDFVANMALRIQLDAAGRPDTILNMDEVRNQMLRAYINLISKTQGIDVESDAEWNMDTKPLLVAAINTVCTPKHLIAEQFGNVPYFDFMGIPLDSGQIPASMVLTEDLLHMCQGLVNLDMTVRQIVNTEQLNIGEDAACYVIEVAGDNDTAEANGKWIYFNGILNYGFLSVMIESDIERLSTVYVIDRIN